MKLPFRPQKKKIQAATVRRAHEAEYLEEPNVKLSSAFFVMLVLHVVAVGGIYAFNAIKAHQPLPFEDADTSRPQQPAETVADTQMTASPAADEKPAPTPAATRTYRVRSGDTIARIASANGVSAEEIIDMNGLRAAGGIHVGQELTLPAGSAEDPPKPVARDSGGTYTVVRGDTPVSIAHKLHVAYADLILLNKIEDPKKLKIGLKLKVPAKRPA
jgi:LysM repeat protein